MTTKEDAKVQIQELQSKRADCFKRILELADEFGIAVDLETDNNRYIPEGALEPCEYCDEGKVSKFLGYSLPKPILTRDAPGRAEIWEAYYNSAKYSEPETCEYCNGTGELVPEYSGWQKSYC